MPSVKCVSLTGDSVAGRRLRPGEIADDVDATDPEVRNLITDGRLVVTDNFDVAAAKVDDVLTWVGDDPQRAAVALASESARPEREQRSTLIGKLDELVAPLDTSPEEV